MDEIQFHETDLGKQLNDLQCSIWAVRAIGKSNKDEPERLRGFDVQTPSDLFEAVYIISEQSNDLIEDIISQTKAMADEKRGV